MSRSHGYARVTTVHDDARHQHLALQTLNPERCHTDIRCTRDQVWPEFNGMMADLKKGDAVIVARIGVFGGDYRQIKSRIGRLLSDRINLIVVQERTPPCWREEELIYRVFSHFDTFERRAFTHADHGDNRHSWRGSWAH